jgi:hypothetical protein
VLNQEFVAFWRSLEALLSNDAFWEWVLEEMIWVEPEEVFTGDKCTEVKITLYQLLRNLFMVCFIVVRNCSNLDLDSYVHESEPELDLSYFDLCE